MNILDLPHEILEKIFIESVHGCSSQRISADTNSSTDPVDLTHVCHLWRVIAISTPQLWATICVNSANSEGDVKMFELWLQRSAGSSGNYPLVLTINQKRQASQNLGPLLTLAIAEHRRWKDVHFFLYGDSQAFLKPLFAVTSLPILRGFEVKVAGWDLEAARHLTRILCSSPALESVHFGSPFLLPFPIDLIKKVVPWHRQKNAGFQILRASQFVQILSFSPNLQTISVFELFGSEAAPILHVTAGSLQSIHIATFNWCHWSDVFDNLTLPSLQKLHLPSELLEIDDQVTGSGSLFRLLERSECTLQVLTIGSPTTTFLQSPFFNGLKVLEITCGSGMGPVLEALGEVCPETQCPRLLPLLEVLTIHDTHSVDRVREIVSARIAAYGGDGRSTLRRVSAGRCQNGTFILDMYLAAA